ncbi:MAG TPA: DUF2130 domain-containing protein [Ferruginibacter sp.]|nr:DUF2130 domain-containing protein [Ferruginibacter sp.]HRO18428.1 DUF2130 domain-containing protein [Ferruginibacter sp.]HRQ21341.1 DUF2130 domain-containing protein [Ferruginibacter sp.]
MSNEIICPKCNHHFSLNEVLNEELNVQLKAAREKLNQEAADWRKQREEEFNSKIKQAESAAEKKATEALNTRLQMLENEAREKQVQLETLRKKELEFLKLQQDMAHREKQIDIEKEKYFLEKSREIENNVIKREQEMFDLKMKEKDTQMESLKKTIDDLKRKSEQGSMQAQGEAQELLLEQILKENFPFDWIEEVGKGVKGADCILTVRNNRGDMCGKIIFESKQTKDWSNAWTDKLKNDMRQQQADIAILVTQAFPKDMSTFGERNGVWICNFREVVSVVMLVRNSLLQLYDIQKKEENKGDKMHMLYDFLTGLEFKGHMEAIAEGFKDIRNNILKERVQMEKLWKEREKQLEKALLNAVGLYGSIKGIAGSSVGNIPLLDGEDTPLIEN